MSNEKIKVLIADDEFRIGILIKKLIKWEELNLDCLEIANNGEQAFELICNEKPRIVITDIQMPRINGLELIAMTKEKYPGIRFIVVSGYKDFEYARRALQYGVNDYLLKPIDAVELNDDLRKISALFYEDFSKKKEEEILKKEVYESKQLIKKNILRNIVNHQNTLSTAQINDKYGVRLEASGYRIIVSKLDRSDLENIFLSRDHITTEKMINIIENAFKDEAEEVLLYEGEALNIFCLLNYDLSRSNDIKAAINKTLSGIQEYLLGFEQYKMTIGIGEEKESFEACEESVAEACKAVGNRIKLGTGRLIYAEKPRQEPFSVPSHIEKYKEKYITAINAYSGEMLRDCIEQIFAIELNNEFRDFYCYYEIARELILILFDQIETKDEKSEQCKKQLLEKCQHCYTVSKLKNVLKKDLSDYLDESLKILEMKFTKPIRQAKQYIEAHYNEKIVLEDIAEIVGLNPVYFSVLFKKETGLNFSVFLTQVRIENAKTILKTTNQTVAYIADSVGYKDVRHFSRLFTKTVGINPALYRKLYS